MIYSNFSWGLVNQEILVDEQQLFIIILAIQTHFKFMIENLTTG
jgi:hypothetical protein